MGRGSSWTGGEGWVEPHIEMQGECNEGNWEFGMTVLCSHSCLCVQSSSAISLSGACLFSMVLNSLIECRGKRNAASPTVDHWLSFLSLINLPT